MISGGAPREVLQAMASLKEEKFSRVTPREDFCQHIMCGMSNGR